jgi:hypothetical protein
VFRDLGPHIGLTMWIRLIRDRPRSQPDWTGLGGAIDEDTLRWKRSEGSYGTSWASG